MITEVTRRDGYDIPLQEKKMEKEENVNLQEKIVSKKAEEKYTAVSKDGDTLEISKEVHADQTIAADSVTLKMSDAVLKNCSKEKLKQLLQNGKISRQQYDKAMKSQKA